MAEDNVRHEGMCILDVSRVVAEYLEIRAVKKNVESVLRKVKHSSLNCIFSTRCEPKMLFV
jgi:hypothetical protein